MPMIAAAAGIDCWAMGCRRPWRLACSPARSGRAARGGAGRRHGGLAALLTVVPAAAGQRLYIQVSLGRETGVPAAG